mgnify:CR=1 FL=1
MRKRIRMAGVSDDELIGFTKSRNQLDEVPPMSGRMQMVSDAEAPPSPLASKINPEQEKKLLEMVTLEIYADDAHWDGPGPDHAGQKVVWTELPPMTDDEAAKAIERADRVANAEQSFYPKTEKDDAQRWATFWDLNRRWRRVEAWLGAGASRRLGVSPASGLSRWLPLWKSYSHDFKRGIDRADPAEIQQNTADLERELGWYGFPKAYHPKDPAQKEALKEQRKGDGLISDNTPRPSISTQNKWVWGLVLGAAVMGGGYIYLRLR